MMGFYPIECRAMGLRVDVRRRTHGRDLGAPAGGCLLCGPDVSAMIGVLAPVTLVAAGAVAIRGIITRHIADRPLQ